jgi:hypothetical protein
MVTEMLVVRGVSIIRKEIEVYFRQFYDPGRYRL